MDARQRSSTSRGPIVIAVLLTLLLGFVAGGRTAAFEASEVEGGMNPAAQRREMIRLLNSIDQRLKELVDSRER
jgi:hypothetical protein